MARNRTPESMEKRRREVEKKRKREAKQAQRLQRKEEKRAAKTQTDAVPPLADAGSPKPPVPEVGS